MESTSGAVLNYLGRPQQYILPIYQRGYGWSNIECKTLFQHLTDVGESDIKDTWYIGAIVCQDISGIPSIKMFVIIDGQQRLTTITIMLCAITEFLREHPKIKFEGVKNWDSLLKKYVINSEEEGDKWYRLLLNNEDKEDLKELIYKVSVGEKIEKHKGNSRVYSNFQFFKRNINKNNIYSLYAGLQKLTMIFIELEKTDVAQNIFETLNATGKSLMHIDKIRNYLLMGLSRKEAEDIYNHYWKPMEKSFVENPKISVDHFDYFTKYYLEVKLHSTIKTDKIYEEFRKISKNFENAKECVKELSEYSQYYLNIFGDCEKDSDLKRSFGELDIIKMRAMSPFLLSLYKKYAQKQISKKEFIQYLELMKSYYFRRSICGWSGNSGMDSLSIRLCKIISDGTYYDVVKRLFSFTGYNRFLNDTVVKEEVYEKNFFKWTKTHFVLTKLVNMHSVALRDTSELDIACIYPEVSEEYLGRLGNLTLDGIGLCMDIRADSPEEFIDKRTEKLTEMILKVWEYPTLP